MVKYLKMSCVFIHSKRQRLLQGARNLSSHQFPPVIILFKATKRKPQGTLEIKFKDSFFFQHSITLVDTSTLSWPPHSRRAAMVTLWWSMLQFTGQAHAQGHSYQCICTSCPRSRGSSGLRQLIQMVTAFGILKMIRENIEARRLFFFNCQITFDPNDIKNTNSLCLILCIMTFWVSLQHLETKFKFRIE